LRRLLTVAALVVALVGLSWTPAAADYANWNEIVDEMTAVLDEAYDAYAAGDTAGGKAKVDEAYFSYYEKLGFERTVLAYISGARAAQVEYQFSIAKKAMTSGEELGAVKAALDDLSTWLREDANQLDGKQESAAGVFAASLLIITREGFEAIIIVGAIIAYLAKSGNQKQVRTVYVGALLALGASVLMAMLLNSLAGANGANQEIIEGATMLLAVAVLFYVSNWMVSKAEAEAWSRYIKGKVAGSISRGSTFSLAFAAFLAVFREGAETILFYQAVIADTQTYFNMIWAGLGVGCVILVVIYLLIRVLSVRLPLKPFFLGTSVLLFIMSISFIGSGIKELQEGNVISVTPVSGISSVDILGIYPTVETLVPQLMLLMLAVASFVIQLRRGRAGKTTPV
jgi:high-affinity iron transporter